jgi:hypothetical protein
VVVLHLLQVKVILVAVVELNQALALVKAAAVALVAQAKTVHLLLV